MGVASATTSHTFGKYSLVAKLATGGMAEIYLARLSGAAGFEKLVCIKRILPHLAKDATFVGMFLDEARIAAQISHPNVCQVFELGEIDQRYFIAMEYLEGVPFACFRRPDMYPAPPDPRLVAGLGVQACEGLHHAHQLKRTDGTLLEVVHRDISANNLFATVDGVVKVLDFGIAKIQDASVRTSTGSVKGTYAYMAPEQLRGEHLDRRTDVFAMGIVLWEMFARRHLFKRETDFLTFQAITADPIPDIAEFRPDVPPEFAATIAKALSRNREDRHLSARVLGEAIAASVASLGGPLSASALSDEIARSFSDRLHEQQALIRIAREGGSLDLEDDLGPGVAVASQDAALLTSPEPGSEMVAMPEPVKPSTGAWRILPILSAVLLVAAIGIGVYLWMQPATPPAPVAVAAVVAIDAAVIPVDAAELTGNYTARPQVRIDSVVEIPTDAAVVTLDAGVTTPPDKPKPPTPVKPKGPPGFITIDSSPMYAVIYIDGKRAGETPLVRIQLAPGRHNVRAVSASGTSQTMAITIEPGKVAPTRRFGW
ncbi:MAG: serine/threonine-protein kinase [Kofleriaceae bacterium]